MANVLVVDDIAIMRNVIKRHIIKLGHTVVAEAENGHNAIIQYKRFNPDIVTMDVTMPAENGVKNGIDALKLIKEFDSNAKVVMVTSHGEEKLRTLFSKLVVSSMVDISDLTITENIKEN